MRLAGIDGCKSGWVAVVADAGSPALAQMHFVTDLSTFLRNIDFAVIDMPIGLVPGPAPRDVEIALRADLKGKASSVFPTPCRSAFVETDYINASDVNEQALGKRLPKQTFMLFPKMREIDAVVRAHGQSRLREGHPEASFATMAGAPVISKKSLAEGRAERIALLEAEGLPARALLGGRIKAKMADDDILDAAALLWTADRFQRGLCKTFPPVPSKDAVGLEMSVIA
jgi:predicted RNase H-like nuclease